MNLHNLRSWILSQEGWKDDIAQLSRLLVQQDFPLLQNTLDNTVTYKPDWGRLLLVASILAKSEERDALEASLTIAQAGFLISGRPEVADSSLLILNQLSNQRASQEAITKGHVKDGFEQRLGILARMITFREEAENKIYLNDSKSITANKFQNEFWESTSKYDWLYASAPTAAGKTFIVFKYIVDQISLNQAKLVIYIAPTRALVSEVEQKIRELSIEAGLKDICISSIPIKELYDLSVPSVMIFTQERLHIFLNSLDNFPKIDILVIDEVQKLNDGMRGVILQDAIERVLRIGTNSQIIYLSPSSENPSDLFKDAPSTIRTKVVDVDQPMVSQNIIWASQKKNGISTKDWQLELKSRNGILSLGDFELDDRPTTLTKKMALIASKLCKDGTGVLVYANGPSEAEDIAEFISEILGPPQNENLNLHALSNLAKDGVHKNFKLVRTVKNGVAFHYGNMPSLIREEIEEGFNSGDVKFLICTSTLIEGVNLSCKTIFVQRPRKGKGKQMEPQDFWNLAGRAGRWGKEFQGNVICVDPDDWKQRPPERSKFRLKKQTEEVLKNSSNLLAYLSKRTFDAKTIDEKYESVLAYLMTSYMRDGSLTNSPWSKNFNPEYINQLDCALSSLVAQIDIPLSIIEKHSGISAVSMQSLLNYFRSSYKDNKKLQKIIPQIPKDDVFTDLENLIPKTPESDDAYTNMENLLRRIHLKLYPAFGFGQQYKHYAVLILNWMQGYTLKRLIENAIKHESATATKKSKDPKSDATIIRDTMREVEEIARFKAPKYISCYTDILKIFLREQDKLDLYPTDYPFDLFLEFGVMTKTLLSLVSLGLSRMSATELGKAMIKTEYNKEECLTWIKENLSIKEIPAFVKKEINKKLSE